MNSSERGLIRRERYHDVKVVLVAFVVQPRDSIGVPQVLVDLPLIWSAVGGATFACLVLKLQGNLHAYLCSTYIEGKAASKEIDGFQDKGMLCHAEGV